MKVYFLIFIFVLFFTVKSFAAPPAANDPNASIVVELQIIQVQLDTIQSQLSSMSAAGIDWNKSLSFVAGLLTSSAFVISAGRKL